MNFMRAIVSLLVPSSRLSGPVYDLAEGALVPSCTIVAESYRTSCRCRSTDRGHRRGAGRIAVEQILALPPPGKWNGRHHVRSDPLSHEGHDLELRAVGVLTQTHSPMRMPRSLAALGSISMNMFVSSASQGSDALSPPPS